MSLPPPHPATYSFPHSKVLKMIGADMARLAYLKHGVHDRIAEPAIVISLGVFVHRCDFRRTVEGPDHGSVSLFAGHVNDSILPNIRKAMHELSNLAQHPQASSNGAWGWHHLYISTT